MAALKAIHYSLSLNITPWDTYNVLHKNKLPVKKTQIDPEICAGTSAIKRIDRQKADDH